jgi:cell division protein FtsL
MNRLAQVHKMLKLADMEKRRLSDTLAGKKHSMRDLLQEKEDVARETDRAEAEYRQILQGEITAFQLARIADIRALIAFNENRKAELGRRLQDMEQEVEALIAQLYRRHGISQSYQTLADQLQLEERSRRDRRAENRCDELSLIRWVRRESR